MKLKKVHQCEAAIGFPRRNKYRHKYLKPCPRTDTKFVRRHRLNMWLCPVHRGEKVQA